MTIDIKDPRVEELIREQVATGGYADAEAVVREALGMLGEREEWLKGNRSEIAEKIDRALEQFERGESYSAEESKAELTRRKAEWMAQRQG
jgi:putative addiction module CopG family antidote